MSQTLELSHSKKTLIAISLYIFLFSVVVGLIAGPNASLTDLSFGYGPELDRILSGAPLRDPSRLPFLPYFLAALHAISDHQLVITIVKNFLIQPLLFYVLIYWWIKLDARIEAVGLIIFLLLFPQVVRHGFSLVPEEGYLIAALAFVFHGLLVAPRLKGLISFFPYAIVTALLFLLKGSMLILAPTLTVLYYYRTRDWRVFLLFGMLLATTMCLWGFMTWSATGNFALSTTLTGYELWKGNNSRTLDYFPHTTLDMLSGEAPQRHPGESPWDWSRRCQQEAISFVLTEPAVAAKLLFLKFYQVFVSVVAENSESWSSSRYGYLRPWLKDIGVIFMVVFRLLFFVSLIHAISAIALKPAGSDNRNAAICYLVVVAAFSAPFLIAWGTERRIIPMVIPTIVYLLYSIDTRAAVLQRQNSSIGLRSVSAASGSVLKILRRELLVFDPLSLATNLKLFRINRSLKLRITSAELSFRLVHIAERSRVNPSGVMAVRKAFPTGPWGVVQHT